MGRLSCQNFHRVVVCIALIAAWMVFAGVRSLYGIREMDAHGAQGKAAFEEQRSWGSEAGLVLKLNRTQTDLDGTVLLTAMLTWDPQCAVYLPDPGLLPPPLAVVGENLEGPSFLDNGSLRAVWTLQIEVLEPGVHLVPELPWVLVERVRMDREPAALDPRTETVRSPAVPIVVNASVRGENPPQNDAFKMESSPPVAIRFSHFRHAWAAFSSLLALLGLAVLIGRHRRKMVSMDVPRSSPCEEEKLSTVLNSVRRELLSSNALTDTSVSAVQTALKIYLNAKFGGSANKSEKNTANEKTVVDLARPRGTGKSFANLMQFCEWYRFGRRHVRRSKEDSDRLMAGREAAETFLAFLEKIDGVVQELDLHSGPHEPQNHRTEGLVGPSREILTRSRRK